MNWIRVRLTDISNPKQWKQLSTSELTEVGYDVYGANGIIGKYTEFNHEQPTLAITCRGATCGSLHITKPESYITGNAMALDSLSSNVDMNFLYYALKKRGFNDIISGSAQPQITRQGLSNVTVEIPEKLEDQIRIATLLNKAEALIKQRKESIDLLDEYLKSTFLEIFGDPVRNEKGWKKVPLKRFGQIITGNTPPRGDLDNFSDNYIEWIKTDNIPIDNLYITKAKEYLSEQGLKKSRFVEKGALLVACIAGSIESVGRASLTDRTVSFNQQINAIQPNEDINSLFLYSLFKNTKSYIQNQASKGMKKILTKGEFEKILMIKPPIELQNQFATIVEKTESLKAQYQSSLAELENLYGSLSQKAFKEELNLEKGEEMLMAAEPVVGYGVNNRATPKNGSLL
jgi:type I restriction enzyme S subunit